MAVEIAVGVLMALVIRDVGASTARWALVALYGWRRERSMKRQRAESGGASWSPSKARHLAAFGRAFGVDLWEADSHNWNW